MWPCTVWAAAVLAVWLTALQLASAEEDTNAICHQHHRSQASTMDLHFHTSKKGENYGNWVATSPGGWHLENVIKFHVINIVEEKSDWTHLCVGVFDTSSHNDVKAGGYFTLRSRPHLPVGIVRVRTNCWRDKQEFQVCDPQFKPMDFLINLPLYNYAPFEENFWRNMTIQGLGVDPKWIWKIDTVSKKGSIPAEWLSRMDLPGLEEILMKGNDWRRPAKLLNYLPRLVKLNFNENNLEIIPKGTFNNTPDLRVVIIGYNNLSEFPSEVNLLKKLWLLDLTYERTKLKITDEAIRNLPPSTEVIGLEFTKPYVNVSSLFLMPNLGFLNLSGCEMTHFRGMDFQNFTNMRLDLLDLSCNKFEKFPPNFFKKLENLTNLILHDNKLRVWDHELLPTNKLLKFILGGNLIENITDESFKHLSKLVILDLSRNTISSLPSFKGMTELKTLDLSRNNIAFIQQDTFRKNSKLTTINLSYNRLANHPHFWSLHIERLDLSHNMLKYFHSDRSIIKKVNLSHNLIENVKVNDIEFLNISFNNLSYISPQMWENINHAEKVDLGGQEFECCLFGNETYFKKEPQTEMLTLGAEKELTCSVNKTAPKILLRSFSYNETGCNPKALGEAARNYVLQVVLPLSLLGVTIAVIAVAMYVYRFELVYFCKLFRMKKVGAEADEQRYKTCVYDAFVCHSSKDKDWVAETLLPGLEKSDESYRLCVHDRDFELGAGINSNIVASLEKSRKVILVLSRDFIASKWCKWEVEMANHKMFEERRDFIILVELERLERRTLPRHLRSLIARTTYLEWPTPEEAAADGAKWQRRTQACFRRLRDALGDSLYRRKGGDPKRAYTVLEA